MKSLWNHLGDPTLHLLAIALLLIYLTVCQRSRSDEARARSPLHYCSICHAHYLDGNLCECRPAGVIAQARR